jgi:hypothetical protein
MEQYIGVKLINASPMTRLEYTDFRGWEIPDDEDGDDEGYLVEYTDGGKANTEEYEGYVSWSPAYVFDRAYQPVEGMNFGLALEALKKGERVARTGWNGKNMWLVLIHAGNSAHTSTAGTFNMQDCIGMKTATGEMQPGWLASQNDMLTDDWIIL